MSAPRSLSKSEAHQRQTAAWEACQAMHLAAKAQPELLDNLFWTALHDTAHARLRAEFEADQR